NLGHGEDRRYQAMRRRHSPGFWWKSLFMVIAHQGVMAWLASLVILGALASPRGLGAVELAGLAVALAGFLGEAVADWHLSRFRADPANTGRVMDRGLWRYSHHPNYFGDLLFWWVLAVVDLAAGQWWALMSPVLLTMRLVNVSGVSLPESDIPERRPAYRDYIRRTPAFNP